MYLNERLIITGITMVIYILLSNPAVYDALDSTFKNVSNNELFLTFIHSILFSFVFFLSTFIYTEIGIC